MIDSAQLKAVEDAASKFKDPEAAKTIMLNELMGGK